MHKLVSKHDYFFQFACFFEASLAFIALFMGWLVNLNPLQILHFSEPAVFFGMLGTLPLCLLFWVLTRLRHPAITEIRQLLLTGLASWMSRCHWTDLLVLAAITGFSEELLFRGVLQPWLETHWDKTAALIGSNVLFALAHAVTPLYLLLTWLVGCYLGLALDYGGERNLLTPMIIHGLYDFFAFMALQRAYLAYAVNADLRCPAQKKPPKSGLDKP